MVMREPAGTVICERTREWVSLRLDAELSEFECALMNAHLACCESCREFEAEVAAITGELREAALQPFERVVSLPVARRIAFGRVKIASAAAAVFVAAVLGGVIGTVSGGDGVRLPQEPSAASINTPPNADPLLRDMRLAFIKPTRRGLGEAKPPLPVNL
jgi:hypothetical protein